MRAHGTRERRTDRGPGVLTADVLLALTETSRTFLLPISRLPSGLQEAVASAYLCMRAIDEIEDHPSLQNGTKVLLLRRLSLALQGQAPTLEAFRPADIAAAFGDHAPDLAPVTRQLAVWATRAPADIAPRIWAESSAMANCMAGWCERGWRIRDETDLNAYTFAVAGAVGLLLSDLWAWYDGTQTDRQEALAFGRGLQAVNILRNRADDLSRSVDFFPDGWTDAEMHAYARRHLAEADRYVAALGTGAIGEACRIPLALAHATLDALGRGQGKLTREEVMAVVGESDFGLAIDDQAQRQRSPSPRNP